MSANPVTPRAPGPVAVPAYHHMYHGEAHVLGGSLVHPIQQPLEDFGKVVMQNTRRETHITRSVGETSVEGLISFKRGYTRVIGTQARHKTDIFGDAHDAWITLSTAVLEGFNVVDILTADRVVAQVSTEHKTDAHGNPEKVPTVSFLGTRFENLRIGGYPVDVTLNLDFCAKKPAGDRPYLSDKSFLKSVSGQWVKRAGLPLGLGKQYDGRIASIKDVKKRASSAAPGKWKERAEVECTLVTEIELPTPISGVKTFGNVIFIPNFGTVALAELEVGINPYPHRGGSAQTPGGSSSTPTGNYFTLKMFNMKLGCPAAGSAVGPVVSANGHGAPG